MWRSAHIHWKVAAPGYTTLVTELFFDGDPHQDEDPIFKASLRVPIVPCQSHGRRYETARFEIVLASGNTL
jgi:protocatechuate 3,4-dioxygenase beta subunit